MKTKISPSELGRVAEQLVKAPTVAKAKKLKKKIVQGFYGE
jgi:hypothetical protein